MFSETYTRLNAENRLTYFFDRFLDGFKSIPQSPLKTALATLYGCGSVGLLLHAAAPATSPIARLMQPLACVSVSIAAPVLFAVGVTASAIPKCAYHAAGAFQRIGLVNNAGEPPLVATCQQEGDRAVMEVFSQGIPISDFEDKSSQMESALNRRVTKITPGKGQQRILLHLAPGDAELPEKAYLPDRKPDSAKIRLGVSLDGLVYWDRDKVPHLLVGGSTGSGKTTLVKSIIYQSLNDRDETGKPNVDVYVADLKGGLDYPVHWRNRDCSFATSAGDALAVTSHIAGEMNHRMDMFEQVSRSKGVPCSSLHDFNRLRPDSKLRRILLVLDEIAELTDTTGMDKPHKEQAAAIVSNLASIARLGRAVGINLVVATQRPDAMVVPGQIKNNLDGRICGKADNVLSQIILDSTDAADRIPKDSQGPFLNQDGILFRGYLFDDHYNSDY